MNVDEVEYRLKQEDDADNVIFERSYCCSFEFLHRKVTACLFAVKEWIREDGAKIVPWPSQISLLCSIDGLEDGCSGLVYMSLLVLVGRC